MEFQWSIFMFSRFSRKKSIRSLDLPREKEKGRADHEQGEDHGMIHGDQPDSVAEVPADQQPAPGRDGIPVFHFYFLTLFAKKINQIARSSARKRKGPR